MKENCVEEVVIDIWSGYLVHYHAVFENSPCKILFGVCVIGTTWNGRS